MPIKQKLTQILSGKLTAEQNIKTFLEKIKKEDKKINSFLYLNEAAIDDAKLVDKKIKEKKKVGRLAGLAVSIKACISVKSMPITCASKTLENYKGTFDADIVKKIKAEDGIIIGITNMDEFACGSTGENSSFGITDNPAAPGHIPGGSSSGPAASVAADFCDIAIGTDTGGSIRNPASNCSIFGVKPSYGRVSRYGLVDLSMSLDTIGPFCKDPYGCALMLEVIAGRSDSDAITYPNKVPNYSEQLDAPKKLKIGLSPEFEKLCTDKRIYALIKTAAEEFAKKTGSEIIPISLKHINLAVQTYYPLVYVEVFSGTRKFDGRKYGKKIEDTCGEEVLRRILGGKEISRAEYHGKYYRKALQVKKIIAKEFEDAFKKVDIILLPTTPILPPKFKELSDPKAAYAFDAFTIPASLAGICGGVAPVGKIDNLPVGIQILAPAFKEELLLKVMNSF